MASHGDDRPWEAFAAGRFGPARWKPLLTLEGAGAREFEVGLTELSPGAALDLHRHRQASIDFVLSGRLSVLVGDRRVEVEPGGCVYNPGDVPHSARAVGPDPARYLTTYACERLGHEIERLPPDAVRAESSSLAYDPWVLWEAAEPWAPIEAQKGSRVRFRRVMDRLRPVELIAGVAEIDPGTHYTRHWHDQAEIYYILRGEGRVWVGETIYAVRPGTCLYIPSRVVHGADSLGREPLALFYAYGCERVGHEINWTPVEEIYADVRPEGVDVPRAKETRSR